LIVTKTNHFASICSFCRLFRSQIYGTWQSCLCLLLVRSAIGYFSNIWAGVAFVKTYFCWDWNKSFQFVPYDVVLVNLENQTGFISTESVGWYGRRVDKSR
jgi:hypothetical protein